MDDTPNQPPADASLAAPLPVGRRWPKVAAAVGVTAGAAIGAAVLAAAATSGGGVPQAVTTASAGSGTNGSASTTTPPAGGMPGMPRGHGRMMFGDGPGMPGGVLHGQFTVEAPGGGYETMQVQNGTVRSITDTAGSTWALVVTSADGTAMTYVVDAGTSVDGGETGVSSIASGDTVRVLAVVSGNTATAKQLTDQTVLQKNGQSWMPQRPAAPGSGMSGGSATGGSTPA